MAGAQKIRIDRVASLTLCGERVDLQEGEGGPQLLVFADGWADGPHLLCNFFTTAETAAELRAVADAVEAAMGRCDAGACDGR